MLNSIKVKNFKSLNEIKIELGRFNILIGENGSGKSNILEAIALLNSFFKRKANYEYLANRGIRNTEPVFFKSLFTNEGAKKPIEFESVDIDGKKISLFQLEYSEKTNSWEDINPKNKTITGEFTNLDLLAFFQNNIDLPKPSPDNPWEGILVQVLEVGKKVLNLKDEKRRAKALSEYKKTLVEITDKLNKDRSNLEKEFGDFLIFAPENTYLRNFVDETQILPLGIRGEGLFKEMKRLFKKRDKKQIEELINQLHILDWFEILKLPSSKFPNEKSIQIKDRFIENSIKFLDQKVANEGFLFLLFYFTLFISEKTPSFFAIDNVDTSFNPKLCTELSKRLVNFSKKYQKQVIITTHNPFILDGLDLTDEEQRLFVVRRNIEGHTTINRIQPKEKLTVKLSEAWMRGYLGGLPSNF